ncbi:MAG: radical SAM protein [Candidatus Anstonellaceae archaeon]
MQILKNKKEAIRAVHPNNRQVNPAFLQIAPVLEGNFFTRAECLENLQKNILYTGKGKRPIFKQLFLETINKCDLKCPMCYTAAAGINGTARNTIEEWKEAVLIGKRQGVRVIAIAGRGEPLLDDRLFVLGEMVRKEGLDFLVFTRCNVDYKIAERLKEVCTSVVIKLFALTPEVHDFLVGVRGAHQKAMAGLKNLLRVGFKAPNLGIDTVIVKKNLPELARLLRFCRRLEVIPFFERLWVKGRGKNFAFEGGLNNAETDVVFEYLRTIDEKEFGLTLVYKPGMPVLAHAETDKRTVTFHIDVFGNVRPGLGTDVLIGNMRNPKDGLENVLNMTDKWNAFYRQVWQEIEDKVEK